MERDFMFKVWKESLQEKEKREKEEKEKKK